MGKNHLVLPSLILELTDKIEHYLTWLLESSEDGMSIEEEQQLFLSSQLTVLWKRIERIGV